MKLRLTRKHLKPTYTIGKLEVWKDGKWAFLCDTLEDKVRDINKNGKFDNGEVKVYGATAIPYGTYNITMNIQSNKYLKKNVAYGRPYRFQFPRLVNVPNFDGVLIHPGNTANDTEGCILVGRNLAVGKVLNSVDCWSSLMQYYFWPAKKSGEPITIEIV